MFSCRNFAGLLSFDSNRGEGHVQVEFDVSDRFSLI